MKQNIGFNWARELNPQPRELNQHPINASPEMDVKGEQSLCAPSMLGGPFNCARGK